MNTTSESEPIALSQLGELDPRLAACLAEPQPIPVSSVDASGRLKPMSPEEQRARAAAVCRMLDEIQSITDATDTDEMWEEFTRGINAARPHRPLFRSQD